MRLRMDGSWVMLEEVDALLGWVTGSIRWKALVVFVGGLVDGIRWKILVNDDL